MKRAKESDNHLLAALQEDQQLLNEKGSLNGTSDQARARLADATARGLDLSKAALEPLQKYLTEAAKPLAPSAIGKPIELPGHIKNLDHPTVRFLAIREHLAPDAATFVACGYNLALIGFADSGEMELAPLKAADKEGKEASWLEEGKSMKSFSSNLYLLHPDEKAIEGTERCLAWIKAKSSADAGKLSGGYYLSSATDYDRETLATTMGKTTALGLPELYLEWDDIPLAEQHQRIEWLKSLGFSLTVNSSGGKSIHGHIPLDKLASFEDAFPVMKLLTALAGSDHAIVSRARRMRLPGALRHNKMRVRGSASTTEQKLLEAATHCYDLSEVRRVLEAEAKQRGWLVDHLETRWSEYVSAKSCLPGNWESPETAWTMSEEMAIAWGQHRRSSGSDGDFDPPVEWRRSETELGGKIRHAENLLFEKHGLAGAYEFVAMEGRLIEKQAARGWDGFELHFAEQGEGAVGQSPFSQVRESGIYSGNSLKLFEESKQFYCWASQRKGALAEWAAYWCKYPINRPDSPTPEEQQLLGMWLWSLAGLAIEDFDTNFAAEEKDYQRKFQVEAFKKYENALNDCLELNKVLPSSVAALLTTRAKAFPVSDVAMVPGFLTSCAAMLGTKYRVEVKPGHTEPMVVWIGQVGAAGDLKTPVTQQVLRPLLKADARGQETYKAALKAYKAADKSDRSEPPKPPRKFVAGDATLEGLCALLENPTNDGIVSYHDELVTFIASLDAYRGKGGPSKDRGHWLSMWSGNEINIIRKGHDPIFIPNTAVSLFGCVQQDKLTELLYGDDATAKSGDGFWARFLWCVPSNPFPAMNRDSSDITKELGCIYGALAIEGKPITVKLSDEAWQLWANQADAWSREVTETYAARQAFLAKMRGYSVRFAGLLHAVDYAERIQEPTGGTMQNITREIPAEVMERALRLSQFFINQFDVLAPQVGGSSEVPQWVTKVLAMGRSQSHVTARDLMRKKLAETSTEAKKLLGAMVTTYDKGRIIPAPRADQLWWAID